MSEHMKALYLSTKDDDTTGREHLIQTWLIQSST